MNAQDPRDEAETVDSDALSGDDPGVDDTSSEAEDRPKEFGGRGGLDPTRYGDWEKNGRCIDF
ncbi:MAG: DUF1674 domain-containing protein [Woeseiaceae bacterium]